MKRLTGRNALITAGGSGIGRAGALRLAAEGARVFVTDIDMDAARETAALVEEENGTCVPRKLDVTDLGAWRRLYLDLESEIDALHVLWHHAGSAGPPGLEASEGDWNAVVDVNMKGSYFGTAYAKSLLLGAKGRGSVIYTASISGLVASPSGPLYSMAKGGIVALARSLAVALAPDGIRCNAICPAAINTPMLPDFMRTPVVTEEVIEQQAEFIAESHPIGRAGEPAEVAAAVAFLASDDASFVTGVALPVDGGYTAK